MLTTTKGTIRKTSKTVSAFASKDAIFRLEDARGYVNQSHRISNKKKSKA
jgi:hypothetical protein